MVDCPKDPEPTLSGIRRQCSVESWRGPCRDIAIWQGPNGRGNVTIGHRDRRWVDSPFFKNSNMMVGGMHILVVEDDRKIAAFIERGLRQEGCAVERADNGVDGFHRAMSEVYDAAVIDVMLPRLNGLDLIQDLRREGNLTPVLILSARNSVDDRIKGLQAGGDDYLVKPFSFAELIARLQALVRRAKAVAEPIALSVLDLQLDLVRRTAVRGGRMIELQPREFALLEYLVRNQGKVVSKTMIMDQVWGYDFDPSTNVVESRISRLRDKVDRGFEHPLIRTIRGAGYVIREDS